MKKALLLVVFLGVVSAISGVCIGFVNSKTQPIIEERLLAAERENLELMFPGAEFAPIEAKDDEGFVLGVYEVKGKGYAVKVQTIGYNSSTPIIALVGFDADGTITGLLELQQQETSGFGTKVFEKGNIDKLFVGKTLTEKTDLLSGATVTSSAMQNAIASAQVMLQGMIK